MIEFLKLIVSLQAILTLKFAWHFSTLSENHSVPALRSLSARSRNFDVWQGHLSWSSDIMEQVVEGGVLTGEKIKFKTKDNIEEHREHTIAKRRNSSFSG